MRNYNPKNYESAEAIAKYDKAFKVRAQLRKELMPLLEAHPSNYVFMPRASSIQEVQSFEPMRVAIAAQELVFLVGVSNGWGPGPDDVEKMFRTLATVFFSFCDAYAAEGFANPQQAALLSIKELGLSL